VALLVVAGGKCHGPATKPEPVTTTQMAPTILAYLGLDPHTNLASTSFHVHG
jgi:hypothetical protein